MVLSGEEAVSGGMRHKGDITEGDSNAIGSVTGAGSKRDDTRVTRGDAKMGTGEETEDMTSRRPDRVLIGCEDTALT